MITLNVKSGEKTSKQKKKPLKKTEVTIQIPNYVIYLKLMSYVNYALIKKNFCVAK